MRRSGSQTPTGISSCFYRLEDLRDRFCVLRWRNFSVPQLLLQRPCGISKNSFIRSLGRSAASAPVAGFAARAAAGGAAIVLDAAVSSRPRFEPAVGDFAEVAASPESSALDPATRRAGTEASALPLPDGAERVWDDAAACGDGFCGGLLPPPAPPEREAAPLSRLASAS